MTNRIRVLREAKGLSVDQLGALIGTSGAQISRLETGERKLTESWMRRIAKALEVPPADLLAAVTLAELGEDVSAYSHAGFAELSPSLSRLGLASYSVIGAAVARTGIGPGKKILVDSTETRLAALAPGDIVLAEVSDPGQPGDTVRILRQYMPPGILTTNRQGRNVALDLDNPDVDIRIVGVVVPDSDPPGGH